VAVGGKELMNRWDKGKFGGYQREKNVRKVGDEGPNIFECGMSKKKLVFLRRGEGSWEGWVQRASAGVGRLLY